MKIIPISFSRGVSLILIVTLVAWLIFEVWKRDQLPRGASEMELKIERISSNHRQWIQKMIQSTEGVKRKEVIRDYLDISQDWPSQVQSAREFFKKNLEGKTMRIKARLAAKSLQAKSLQTLLTESRGIFEKALEGKIDDRFKDLLQYNSNHAYEKIFPKMKNSN